MESAAQGSRSESSGPATLNEVLIAEIGRLRPALLDGLGAATFADSADQRTQNLRDIYRRIATLRGDGSAGTGSEPLSALCLSGGGIRSATFNLGILQGLAKIGLLGKFDYLSSVSGGGYIAGWLRTWMHRRSVAEVVRELGGGASDNPLAPEPMPVVNLREYSNYLTPQVGLFSGDTWAAAGIVARNLILNWLVLVPLLAAVTGVPLLFLLVVRGTGVPEGWYRKLLYAALGIELLASLSVYAFRRFAKRPGTPQSYFILGCVLPICLAAGVLSTAGLGLALPWHDAEPHPCCGDISSVWKFSLAWCVAIPLIGWSVAEVFALVFPAWTRSAAPDDEVADGRSTRSARGAPARQVARFWEVCALIVSGLVGASLLVLFVRNGFSLLYNAPALYVMFVLPVLLGIYLISRVLFVGIASLSDTSNPLRQRGSSDDADREWWGRLSGWVLLVMIGWAAITGICLLGVHIPVWIDKYVAYSHQSVVNAAKMVVSAVGTIAGVVAALMGSSAKTPAGAGASTPLARKLVVELCGVLFVVSVFIMLSWGTMALGQLITDEPDLFRFKSAMGRDSTPVTWTAWFEFLLMLFGLAGLAVAAGRGVNVNRFSLHGMYRNRLVRAYLGASNSADGSPRKPDPFTGFALDDNVPLHSLCSSGPDVRPLSIINTTLNLVHGENLAWQQRKAESFSMTPLYCGNWSEGYRPSKHFGGPAGITVGTAITISGAAANPNMGYSSSPVLAFLMGVFNVRLGAWLGNPNPHGNKTFTRPGPRQAIVPLFSEIFGLTNSRRGYVNLSDGGHFDNLGLYEAVLRRCRHVLVSDAGHDESFAFEDLGNAIRKIRIDFGIPIVFKQKIEIRPNKPGDPGLYCAIATIGYRSIDGGAGVEDGDLVYIKPTLRGRLSPPPTGGNTEVPYDVYSYSCSSADFPHESTVNQWFSESQFESYRVLGLHILGQLGGALTDAGFNDFLANVRRGTQAP
jgi:Patatin-like phospholipase